MRRLMPRDRLVEFALDLIENLFGWRNARTFHQYEQFPAFEAEYALRLMLVQPFRSQQFNHGKFAYPRTQLGSGELIIESVRREVKFDSH